MEHNATFHAKVSEVKGPYETSLYFKNIVLLNPGTMKKFNFYKGENVLLCNKNDNIVLKVWPCSSIHPSSVAFPTNQRIKMAVNSLKVHHYRDVAAKAKLALKVYFTSKEYKDFMDNVEFKNFIIKTYENVIIKEGTTCRLTYRGYPCELKIVKVETPILENSPIAKSHDVHHNVPDASKAELESNKAHDILEEEHSELNISLNDISTPVECSTPLSSRTIHVGDKDLLNGSSICEHDKSFTKLTGFYEIVQGTEISVTTEENTEKLKPRSTLFTDIGGLSKQIEQLKTLFHSFLSPEAIQKVSNTYVSSGILLHGPPGTGKSLVVQAISNECHVPFILSKGAEILKRYQGSAILNLRKLFKEASERAPCILCFEEIDALYSIGKSSLYEERAIMKELPRLLDDLSCCFEKPVIVLATTHNIELVDPALRGLGRLEVEIEFMLPNPSEREAILRNILVEKSHSLTNDEIIIMSQKAHAFTGADLEKMCKNASFRAFTNQKVAQNKLAYITYDDMNVALMDVKQNIMRESCAEIAKVHWNEIGGMHKVKEEITDIIENMSLKHQKSDTSDTTPSRGILMYGPPGCSKTMIAKAVATESGLNFLLVNGPELFNPYVGESEKEVRQLFRKARSSAPCIIFFDEIESLTSVRGSSSGGSNVADRVLVQLLAEIDGINIMEGVYIIAATNQPHLVDPSFLRPGRFNPVLYVPLPDVHARKEILEIQLNDRPVGDDIDFAALVDKTDGYSGAEIVNLCSTAAEIVLHEDPTSMSSVIKMLHFEEAFKCVKPKTSKKSLSLYEKFLSKYLTKHTERY